MDGNPVLLLESVKPVREQVEGEFELELVVAAGSNDGLLVVGRRMAISVAKGTWTSMAAFRPQTGCE
jgi:hypothetical protein